MSALIERSVTQSWFKIVVRIRLRTGLLTKNCINAWIFPVSMCVLSLFLVCVYKCTYNKWK